MTWGSVKNSGGACVFCTVPIRGTEDPLELQYKIHKSPQSFWHSLKSFQLQFQLQFQCQSKFPNQKLINSPGQRPRACLRKFRAPTTDQKPGHRPLSFSSGGDLGGYRAVIFRLFFVAKNHLHFYCQNLEKTMVFGGQNGIENSIFRVLEGIGFRH